MTIKHPEGIDFSYKDNRTEYEIFFDLMYQAYLQEKHDNNESKDILSKTDYFEVNQDFLLTKFKEEA